MVAVMTSRTDVPLIPGVNMPSQDEILADWDAQSKRNAGEYRGPIGGRRPERVLNPKHATTNFGENNKNAKLTAEQVYEIRARYDAGLERLGDISKDYGIHEAYVSQIGLGDVWSHLPERAAS